MTTLAFLLPAGLVIDADVVVPVSVHEAVVAVAERSGADSIFAGAGWLQHAWASLKGGRAPVVVVIAAVATVFVLPFALSFCLGFSLGLGELDLAIGLCDLLKVERRGCGKEEGNRSEGLHLWT